MRQLDKIRLATAEEIKSIEDKADLTNKSTVLAMGNSLGVIRVCTEIDPVFFGEGTTDVRKYWFISSMENMLRGQGMFQEYYFNVPISDEKYNEIVQNFGATPTSREPEIRYKIVL